MARLLTMMLLCIAFATPTPGWSVEPDEILDNPGLEKRARAISLELRCLVCQNQSIDDSDAPLAKDLRVLVRQRLVKGESDKQVMDFIVARYGEFVLLKPRFAAHTLILWLAPPLLFIIGIFVMLRSFRRRGGQSGSQAAALSAKEKRALNKLLKQG